MNRFGQKARLPGGCAHKVVCDRQIKVNQLPATRADCMIVPFCLAVVTARAIAEADLMHQPSIFQIFQRIVDGRVADRRQDLARRRENLAGRHVILALADHLKDSFALRRERSRSTLISVT